MYDLVEGPKDYQNRMKTAAEMRKDIEATYGSLSGANDILAKLLTDDKKAELAEEVSKICMDGSTRCSVAKNPIFYQSNFVSKESQTEHFSFLNEIKRPVYLRLDNLCMLCLFSFSQIKFEKYPSSIRCWDSNPRPSAHESPPIITRPGHWTNQCI